MTETATPARTPFSAPTYRWQPNSAATLVGTQVGLAVLRLISNIVITRLLVPADFGAVMLLTSVLFVVELAGETGIPPYVIRQSNAEDPRVINTLWTIQILRGLFLATIVWLFAPLITRGLGQPDLTLALQVMAIPLVIEGFRSMSIWLSRRHQTDWRNSIFELLIYVIQLVIAIIACWTLKSYWGLVIGLLSRSVLSVIVSYALYRYPRQQLQFDTEVARSLWGFAKFIFASSLMTILINQIDKFLVLKNLSLGEAGLYNLAIGLVLTYEGICHGFASRIYLADVSSRLRDGGAGADAYYAPMRLMRPALTAVAAAGVGFGPTFFSIIYDPRFVSAGVIFSVLVIRAIMTPTSVCAQNFLIADEDRRSTLVSNGLRAAWLLVAGIWAWQTYGAWGLFWAVALSEVPAVLYYYWRLWRKGVFQFTGELTVLIAAIIGLSSGFIASAMYRMVFGE